MLLRFDPFRELDRVADRAWGRPSSPMPLDAVRRGDTVIASFDLPGVDPTSIDVTVERNVLNVRAARTHERTEGDEVLIPAPYWVSYTEHVVAAGAKPIVIPMPDDHNAPRLTPEMIKPYVTPRTKAILPVHLYGLLCDMRALRRIADAHKLAIVEDSAHCVEGIRDGVRPGGLSDVACFSF